MTQDELDALPEGDSGPMFQPAGESILAWDIFGRAWSTGWQGKVHVKKREPMWDRYSDVVKRQLSGLGG